MLTLKGIEAQQREVAVELACSEHGRMNALLDSLGNCPRLEFSKRRQLIKLQNRSRIVGVEGQSTQAYLAVVALAQPEEPLPNLNVSDQTGDFLDDNKAVVLQADVVLQPDELCLLSCVPVMPGSM